MKWIKASENSDPGITKWYIVRTDSHAGRCYCDNKNALKRYCHLNNINLNEVEWLDESDLPNEPSIQEEEEEKYPCLICGKMNASRYREVCNKCMTK